MKSNSELLRLAAKANGLATRLGDDVERPRLAARIVRHPDVDALSLSIVYDVKHDGSLADAWRTGEGLVGLHCAIEQVTELIWEDLSYDVHPDWPDQQLTTIWQERAVAVLRECGQEWVLEINNVEEYIQALLAAGADKELAEALADCLANVRRAEPGEEGPENDNE